MDDFKIIQAYSQALFDVMISKYDQEATDLEIGRLIDYLNEKDANDLYAFLNRPTISKAKKKDAISSYLKNFSEFPEVTKFVHLLVDKGRVNYLASILHVVERLFEESQSIQSVAIYSAVPLALEQQEALLPKLKKFFKVETINVRTLAIDESLIAGFVVKPTYSSLIIDCSLSASLEKLTKFLKSYTL